jgi:hypothetical protein
MIEGIEHSDQEYSVGCGIGVAVKNACYPKKNLYIIAITLFKSNHTINIKETVFFES